MQQLRCLHAFSDVYFLLMFSSLALKVANADGKKLMFILVDGFRWDYPDRQYLLSLTGFPKVAGEGVRAEYTIPVSPTLSYPNYYSILTGLYPESHGIILNYMYNPANNDTFTPSKTPYWWEEAEPFWATATKQGLRVNMYLWPGCDVPNKGVKPNYCIPYTQRPDTIGFGTYLGNAVDSFAKNESDIAFVYCEQPDFNGHALGPDSPLMYEVVQEVDLRIHNLLKNLVNQNMRDKVDVIIMSDHGMTNIKLLGRIPLQNYINKDDIITTVDGGAIMGVYPNEDKLEKVYQDLLKMPNVRVWKKADIPEEYHLKDNARTPPILVLCNPGYNILMIQGKSVPDPLLTVISGNHGYDIRNTTDMRGIFYATGPSFKNNTKILPIGNQDVYNLLCYLSDLQPLPNNGTWDNVAAALKP